MFYLAFLFMNYQDLAMLMSMPYIIVHNENPSPYAVIRAILKS